jgi:serine/threonine-protein kinase RsbT
MAVLQSELTTALQTDYDIIKARQLVRETAIRQRFSLIEQTKLITAASELARNTVLHGGGGELRIEVLSEGARVGIRLTFTDHGPGIANIQQAMQDGFTSGGGLGLGLGGAKRLVNEFTIASENGKGTRITIARWK